MFLRGVTVSHVGCPAHVHVGQVLEPRGLADEHVDLPLDGERQHVLVGDALAPDGDGRSNSMSENFQKCRAGL